MKPTFLMNIYLPILLIFGCELPEDPAKNPDNASIEFTTINNQKPKKLNTMKSGEMVNIGYNIHLPHFIDSIKISILSIQKEKESEQTILPPWKNDHQSISISFPKAGTKTCLITGFINNGSICNAELVFIVVYPPGNHSPQ